jgi:hypothetical protein
MWLFSLLRNRTSNSTARARSQHRRPAPRFRPQLEALEDRCVPSTLTVTNNLDSSDNVIPGSLRYEINVAQIGDTIVFDKSLQSQTIRVQNPFGGPAQIEINKSVNIQGLGAKHLAISGIVGGSRVFRVDQGVQVTISGLTIENGGGTTGAFDPVPDDAEGGAIINYGTLTLTGCTLSGNSVDLPGLGGAIYNAGTLTLSSCTVTGNSAPIYGGGLYNAGTLTLSGTTVSGNSAALGGGLYNAGTLTLNGSDVERNSARVGGGIYNASSGILTVLNHSMVTHNTGGDLANLGTWSADSTSMIGP